jgi:hypothetical protein
MILVARTGNVWVAPLGTTLPTSPTQTMPAAWNNLGKINTSGITVTPTANTSSQPLWQNNENYEIVNQETHDIAFEMAEWTPETSALYFNPDEIDTTAGTFIVGKNSQPVEVALFINFISGPIVKGIAVPNFRITERSALNLVSTGILLFPVSGRAVPSDVIEGGAYKVYDPQLIGSN